MVTKIRNEGVSTHAESRDHATIGRGNIFRLRKDEDWMTVKFVENINFYAWLLQKSFTCFFKNGELSLIFL